MNDRNKTEHNRIHRQEIRITGAEPSLYQESGWCLKYVKEQCTKAELLYKGPTLAYTYVGVSKQDMYTAQELIDDAQQALDDPTTHPQLGFAWAGEHKSEAYRFIKVTRDGHYFARQEVEKLHVVSVEALLSDAWSLYKKLDHDSRVSSIKPKDVFEKLKEVQRLITESFLKKPTREELRNKVERLWRLVQEFIDESKRQYEDRQAARQVREEARTAKQEEWRARQYENIARWQSRIENGTAFIERLQDQISSDEEKLEGARSVEFAVRVQGWIDEKVAKIAQVVAEINELQGRINDVRRRLNESNS